MNCARKHATGGLTSSVAHPMNCLECAAHVLRGPRLHALPTRAGTHPLPRAQGPLPRTARGAQPTRVVLAQSIRFPSPYSPSSPLGRTSCVSAIFSECGQEPGTPLTSASFDPPSRLCHRAPSHVAKDCAFPPTPTSIPPTSPHRSYADSATLIPTEGDDWTRALDLALSTGMLIGARRWVVPPALPPHSPIRDSQYLANLR
ncbi:hypothetical protein HWV62_13517 [Athelia sp. TMB]|nr:hypothetical protein HWV62_13517 [Athelia sp. TMB]